MFDGLDAVVLLVAEVVRFDDGDALINVVVSVVSGVRFSVLESALTFRLSNFSVSRHALFIAEGGFVPDWYDSTSNPGYFRRALFNFQQKGLHILKPIFCEKLRLVEVSELLQTIFGFQISFGQIYCTSFVGDSSCKLRHRPFQLKTFVTVNICWQVLSA